MAFSVFNFDLIKIFDGNIMRKEELSCLKQQRKNNQEKAIINKWNGVVVCQEGKIIIFGGQDPERDDWKGKKDASIYQVEIQNKKNFNLKKMGQMMEGKDVFGYCLVENYVYIVGGRTDQVYQYSKTFERFCTKTFVTEKLPDCLYPAGQPALIQFQNRSLFKVGGWKSRNQLCQFIERFDIQKQVWTLVYNFSYDQLIKLTYGGNGFQFSENEFIFLGGCFEDFTDITNQTLIIKVNQDDHDQIDIKINQVLMPIKGTFWFTQTMYKNDKFFFLLNMESLNGGGACLIAFQHIISFDGNSFQQHD